MEAPTLSWAAIARKSSKDASEMPAASNTLGASTPTASSSPPPIEPRVSFVSGHVDITPEQFSAKYANVLDAAIRRGDAFVLSNSRGADTLALAHLRAREVHPSRITIYFHAPRPSGKFNATRERANKMNTRREVVEKYTSEGYSTRVIQGYHTERDAAMTDASDYDILWVRGEAETATLYGSKYRPGRISGTQKNADRRLLKNKKTPAPSGI